MCRRCWRIASSGAENGAEPGGERKAGRAAGTVAGGWCYCGWMPVTEKYMSHSVFRGGTHAGGGGHASRITQHPAITGHVNSKIQLSSMC